MLIVVEGCDGVGKTTLVNLLSTALDATVIHCSTETPNNWKYFRQWIEESWYENIIADRFFWGQFVYQNPEGEHINKDQLHQLEGQLTDNGGKIIWVTAPNEVIQKRLENRGETLINGLTIEQVQQRFHNLVRASYAPVYKYDTESLTITRMN